MHSFKNGHALFEAIYTLAFYIACNLLLGCDDVVVSFLSVCLDPIIDPATDCLVWLREGSVHSLYSAVHACMLRLLLRTENDSLYCL